MIGPIELFMTGDHAAISSLLERALPPLRGIHATAYEAFRAHLRRHIEMEDRILLPEAERLFGDVPVPMLLPLRRWHRQLAGILDRSPTRERCRQLRDLLVQSNHLEEGPEGLYAMCDDLAGSGASTIAHRLREYRNVASAPRHDAPLRSR